MTDKTEEFSLASPQIPDLEVFNILGKGGSGTVYKGRQPFLNRDVAIKVLNVNQNVVNEDFVQRFHREARILADLIHPNIVSCFQAGMTLEASDYPVSPYLAMEFVEGPSLQDWIKKVGIIDQVTALNIIEQITLALDYSFKKTIIHRDIKAENILLKPLHSNEGADSEFNFTPKLADLGIARSTQSDKNNDLTVVGTMLGTPSSMAPEQFNDPDNVDFKVDIYGLGCVLFHMVTGKKPFAGYNLTEMVIKKNSLESLNPKEINPKLNTKVVDLILSMMAVDKDDRPPSYEDLIHQCQSVTLNLGLSKKNKKKKQGAHGSKKNSSKKNGSEKNYVKWGFMASIFSLLLATIVYFFWPEITATNNTTRLSVDTNKSSTSIVSIDETNIIQSNNELKNTLEIRYADKNDVFLAPGESFNLMVSTQQDAYIYCYFENQKGEISRFFPNRFNIQSLILKSKPLILPGDSKFNMNASNDGISERVACFATAQNIIDRLPSDIVGVDFEALPVSSLEEVKAIYLQINETQITDTFFDIRVF